MQKAGLKANVMVQDADFRCPRNHHLNNTTVSKMQNQETTTKKSCSEEFKPKKLISADKKFFTLFRSNNFAKQFC